MRSEWREFANCVGQDPEMFFPRGVPLAQVRQLCDDCPVRPQCLREALSDTENTYGVWAGLTRKQRRRLARA